MATPKVFVSSTCYDLKEIRESLSKFISMFGFDPILSDYGDVFYHPDLHTHESCVHEISNCHLFILIIGGRFGGKYILDRSKSITNAEYEAARNANIPIFTFIKHDVFDNHHVFIENKDKPFLKEISFPAIENQEFAPQIFSFIDQVRKASKNNAYESFRTFQDVESHLRKQWAGMFFEYLKSRTVIQEIKSQKEVLLELSNTSAKLETIVKSFYKNVSPVEAEVSIDKAETFSNALSFVQELFSSLVKDDFTISALINTSRQNKKWHEYLNSTGLYTYAKTPKGDEVLRIIKEYKNPKSEVTGYIVSDGVKYNFIEGLNKKFIDGFSKLSNEELATLLRDSEKSPQKITNEPESSEMK